VDLRLLHPEAAVGRAFHYDCGLICMVFLTAAVCLVHSLSEHASKKLPAAPAAAPAAALALL
jgi:hypothetical protein